jgi:hypothetical protein
MRKRGFLLAPLALALAAPAAASVPGASYPWAQPGATRAVVVSVQPPAWVPIAAAPVQVALPGSSYPWAQPDATRPAGTPSVQPPAGIIP